MRRIKRKERRRFVRREPKVKGVIKVRLNILGIDPIDTNLAIVDISEGGMRVQLEHPLPQEEFSLRLDVVQLGAGFSAQIILPCKAAWGHSLDGDTWSYGLEFVATKDSCALFNRVLNDLAEAKGDLVTV